MREVWTAEIVGKLHLYNITYEEIGKKLGIKKNYVGMILNGIRKPKGAKERFEAAIDEIIKEKTAKQ